MAQHVLGVYIQEYSHKCSVYNNGINYEYRNSLFCIEHLSRDTLDETFDLYKKSYPQKPLEIGDCIYFNPMDKYTSNYSSNGKYETYFFLNKIKQGERHSNILPNSLRLYIDTSEISIVPGQIEMVLDSNFKVPIEKYLRPFYFKKHEVTNAEYREFTNWVRDSITRILLAECGVQDYVIDFMDKDSVHQIKINWSKPIKPEEEDVEVCLQPLYKPPQERFYDKKEIDTRKLNYSYLKKIEEKVIPITINIYPDTNCWVNDFAYSFNEPMTNLYYWHPAYNDYPVVGISYWQTLAFLDWKTKQHQKKLDAKGIKIKVEYDLPTEIEWEIASTAEKADKTVSIYTKNYQYFADNSWVTDLSLSSKNMITRDSIDKTTNRKYTKTRQDLLFEQTKKTAIFRGDFKVDGFFHTCKSDINKISKQDLIATKFSNSEKSNQSKENSLLMSNKDALGICFMGGNVSEWLKESYKENWEPIFIQRQRLLRTFKEKDVKILAEIESYYDKNNDKDGKLVRGSNWYDERFSSRLGKNTEGSNAKVFVSPDIAHSTLGFRYVIHYSAK